MTKASVKVGLTMTKKVSSLATATELGNELELSHKRTKAILKQIRKRAKVLCTEHPNVPLYIMGDSYISGDLFTRVINRRHNYSDIVFIKVIKQIELSILN